MLELHIPSSRLWSEKYEVFVQMPGFDLQLEHSLISVAKWEAKNHVPFISKEKTKEELIDYIECMSLTKIKDPEYLQYIPDEYLIKIADYIKDSNSAHKFNNKSNVDKGLTPGGRNITAEIIYSWMIQLNIPIEFQKWHFNRLITLIRVVRAETQPREKMPQREWAQRRAELNAARLKKYNTKG